MTPPCRSELAKRRQEGQPGRAGLRRWAASGYARRRRDGIFRIARYPLKFTRRREKLGDYESKRERGGEVFKQRALSSRLETIRSGHDRLVFQVSD